LNNNSSYNAHNALGNTPVFTSLQLEECCGCEACVNACPKQIISLQPNREGFYYPAIDTEKCIKCGLCKNICPVLIEKNCNGTAQLVSYAGSSLDKKTLEKSSSGGMFSAIVNNWINNASDDFYISGVVYDDDFKGTHHILSRNNEDILQMRTSKYVQSRKGDIYPQIRNLLSKGKNVLFSGTPCEVAALYSYLGDRPNNLFTIDIICQGPTSPKVLHEYTELLEKNFSSSVSYINMRHKERIWIPQYLLVKMASGDIVKNLFYDTPLGAALHIMQRKSCYRCKFIGKHKHSDITIGDYHGADKSERYYNSNGTSIIIGNTDKGIQLIENISKKDNIYLERKPFEEIAKTNIRLTDTWDPLPEREKFVKLFSEYGLETAARETRNKSLIQKIFRNLPVNVKQNILAIKRRKEKKVSM